MNEVYKMHASFAKSFFKGSAIVAGLVVIVFILKAITGYENLCYIGEKTLDFQPKITTHTTYRRRRHITYTFYKVIFTDTETNKRFTVNASRDYYNYFVNLNSNQEQSFSVFTDEDNNMFPATTLNCTEREAEREYRKCYKPNGYYWFYRIGLIIAGCLAIAGLNANRMAKKYEKDIVYYIPRKPDPQETALLNELDELLENDKYGRYKNRKYK